MTEQERVNAWFRDVPNADALSMDQKTELCRKIAGRTGILFFAVLAAECALVFLISGGAIFDRMAEFINLISAGSSTAAHRRGTAIIGGLICLPFIVLPFIAAGMFRKKWIRSAAEKAARHA